MSAREHIVSMLAAFRALDQEDEFASTALIDSAAAEATRWFATLLLHKEAPVEEVADELVRIIENERIEFAVAEANSQAVAQ